MTPKKDQEQDLSNYSKQQFKIFKTKEEREANKLRRKNELIAALSAQDNSRTLRKIILDKIWMIVGIMSGIFVSIWFMLGSIIPGSVLGTIGHEYRKIDTVMISIADSNNITDGSSTIEVIWKSNSSNKNILTYNTDEYVITKHSSIEANGNNTRLSVILPDGGQMEYDYEINGGKIILVGNNYGDGTVYNWYQWTSAHNTFWTRVTDGASSKNTGVYDLFFMQNSKALMTVGTISCTIVVLLYASLICVILTVYTRDILLIIKTTIIIAKENNRERLNDIKQAIRDTKNLYKTEDEQDKFVEVKIPGKKQTKSKITKKKVDDTNIKAATDAVTVPANDESSNQSKQNNTSDNDNTVKDNNSTVDNESSDTVKQEQKSTAPEISLESLTEAELNALASNTKTIEQIIAERNENKEKD